MTFNTSSDKIKKIIDAIKKEKENKSVEITNAESSNQQSNANVPKK